MSLGRYVTGIENRRIDVTTHGDDLDPGVAWAIRNPQEAEEYVRRMHHEPDGFWTRLFTYLREAW